jgi:hypothetical protein
MFRYIPFLAVLFSALRRIPLRRGRHRHRSGSAARERMIRDACPSPGGGPGNRSTARGMSFSICTRLSSDHKPPPIRRFDYRFLRQRV